MGTPPPARGDEQQQVTMAMKRNTYNEDRAFVVGLLGSDRLLERYLVSPESLAWIAREAPKKKSPAGWAAQAIRKGWQRPDVPRSTLRAVTERIGDPPREPDRVERHVRLLTEEQKQALLPEVLRQFPNLHGCGVRDKGVTGAMMAVVRRQWDEIKGGCKNATVVVESRHG